MSAAGTFSVQRVASVARKEVFHILRDPATLFFALLMPVMEMFLLGYAIDTNVRDIRTVVLNLDGKQQSRDLLQRFENSKDFKIVKHVFSDAEFHQTIV